jgi:hypothetical protein
MQVGSGGSGDPEVMVDINTTPLIDVMLVLLIMLIITIPIQTHAVKLNMPVGTPPPPLTQPEVVDIDVDFDGRCCGTAPGAGRPNWTRCWRPAVQPEVICAPTSWCLKSWRGDGSAQRRGSQAGRGRPNSSSTEHPNGCRRGPGAFSKPESPDDESPSAVPLPRPAPPRFSRPHPPRRNRPTDVGKPCRPPGALEKHREALARWRRPKLSGRRVRNCTSSAPAASLRPR